MIKAKVSTDYKDIERIFAGGAIQKEIIKVWSTEANDYVFEAWMVLEMEGPLPLTFNANGEPLIDYRIYGNTEQTGTPTPENPIMPIGCGERTENLFDKVFTSEYTLGSNGYPISYRNASRCATLEPIDVSNINTVTFSFVNTALDIKKFIYALFNGSTLVTRVTDSYSGDAIDVSQGNKLYLCVYSNSASVEAYETTTNIMLNLGSTPLPYEPYGYKLPILSNSTVTNIYLGESQTTRRIKKMVFDGEENWSRGSYAFFYSPTGMKAYTPVLCTYYQYYEGLSSKAPTNSISTGGGVGIAVWIKTQNHNGTTLAQWKSYLAAQYAAGTPVTVWYVLDEPETGISNEPLMKIGDYADTVDSTQATVQIPTSAGTTIIDYVGEKHLLTSDGYELVDKNQNGFLLSGSTLRPEKMYIKYKGR